MWNNVLSLKNSPRALWLLRLSLGVLIIALLLWWQGATIVNVFTIVPWWTILVSVFSYWILQLICVWKWHLLLNAALRESDSTSRVSLIDCAKFYLAGMFWNLWMPSSIGGDTVRVYLAGKSSGRLSVAASAVLMDRLSGLIALLMIGCVAVAVGGLWEAQQKSAAAIDQSEHLLWLGICFIVLAGLLWIAAHFFVRRFAVSEKKILSRVAVKWESLHRSLSVFLRRKTRRELAAAMGLSLLFQAGLIGLNMGLAFAVHLPLPYSVFWWLVPALSLAALLPVGIGGLGVREAAAVALVGTMVTANGGDIATLIAWSLLWQATLWLAGLPGAWSSVSHQQKAA